MSFKQDSKSNPEPGFPSGDIHIATRATTSHLDKFQTKFSRCQLRLACMYLTELAPLLSFFSCVLPITSLHARIHLMLPDSQRGDLVASRDLTFTPKVFPYLVRAISTSQPTLSWLLGSSARVLAFLQHDWALSSHRTDTTSGFSQQPTNRAHSLKPHATVANH